jgi:hypothetical protein
MESHLVRGSTAANTEWNRSGAVTDRSCDPSDIHSHTRWPQLTPVATDDCGIRYVYLYGTYPTGTASPLTYYWKSGDEIRRHAETVPAGQAQHSYTIDTGPGVGNLKVVFAVPASK